jgi:hypothetical protein
MMPPDQKDDGKPPGRLKDMEWICGTWTGQIQRPEGRIEIRATFSWIHDKRFLRAITEYRLAGGVVGSQEDTWFWDPVGMVVKRAQFESDGAWALGKIYVTSETNPTTFRSYDHGVDKDGKPLTRSVVVKKIGDDCWSYQEFGIALGVDHRANDQEDWVLEFRRYTLPIAQGAGEA